jgi:hypothetical protein
MLTSTTVTTTKTTVAATAATIAEVAAVASATARSETTAEAMVSVDNRRRWFSRRRSRCLNVPELEIHWLSSGCLSTRATTTVAAPADGTSLAEVSLDHGGIALAVTNATTSSTSINPDAAPTARGSLILQVVAVSERFLRQG